MRRALPVLVAMALALLPAAPAWAKHRPRSKAKSHVRHGRHARHAAAKPVPVYTAGGAPNVQAPAAVVIDLDNGTELYARQADAVRPIASISKLIAMLVAVERRLDLDGVTTITPEDRDLAVRGARSRLVTGFSFTNRDLLHAALIGSDNRAVLAIGRAIGLTPAQFAEAMTRKAKALGLKHTSFGDPTGLDERNRSTARELVRVLAAVLRVPMLAEICRKADWTVHAVNRPSYAVEYRNTDHIVRGGRHHVLAGKTGYTDPAGYCLAIAARIPAPGDAPSDGKAAPSEGRAAPTAARPAFLPASIGALRPVENAAEAPAGSDEKSAGEPTPPGRNVAMVFLGEQGKLTRFGDFTRVAQWLTEKRFASAVAEKGAPAR